MWNSIMNASRLVRTCALSALTLVSLSATAFAAEEAYTKSNANMREGPGTKYDVVDTLPGGSAVSVEACSLNWCAVTSEDDQQGFVAKSLLRGNRIGAETPFSIGITVGPQHPFGRFGQYQGGDDDLGDVGATDQVPYPPKHVRNDNEDSEVCFYQQENFKGANFCVQPGDSDEEIPGSFNDAIESVLVSGDSVVEVCASPDFHQCQTYDHSVGKLPISLRDDITSYSVDGSGGSAFADPDDEDPDEPHQSQWDTPDTNGGNIGSITLDN
jgi:uncharacterized protein YraI